jgi:DNA-binding HxlR family transcriptional regulator
MSSTVRFGDRTGKGDTEPVALPREYTSENCPIARSLEVVGERWTLLIVRDAFYGVRRFSDFRAHLGIPKAVLADRLALLVSEGVLAKTGANSEYALTEKGHRLWPVLRALIDWGNDNYVEPVNQRTYRHADCAGIIGGDGSCANCGRTPDAAELVVHPALQPLPVGDDQISTGLRRPHRLLEPFRRDPPPAA